MKTVQPTENYIFAKKITMENTTASGIMLASSPEKKVAEVINIGSNVKEISPRDQIYYIPTPHSQDIKVDGDSYMLINKENVLGIIKEV